MRLLENLSIRTKLIVVLLPLVFLTGVAIFYVSIHWIQLNEKYQHLLGAEVMAMKNAARANRGVSEFERAVYQRIATQDSRQINEIDAGVNAQIGFVRVHLALSSALAPQYAEQLADVGATFERVVADVRRVRARSPESPGSEIQALENADALAKLDLVSRRMVQIVDSLSSEVTDVGDRISDRARNEIFVAWLLGAIGALISIGAALVIARLDIVRAFEGLRDSIAAITQGRLDEPVPFGGLTNEFGAIGTALGQMQLIARDRAARTWTKSSVDAIAVALQSAADGPTFAQVLFAHLAKDAKILYGALYLVDGTGTRYVRTGGYATCDDGREVSFALGQGLVGQCAADATAIDVATEPDTSPLVLAGTVDILPSFLRFEPVVRHGKTIAILELASVAPFSAQTRALLAALLPFLALNLDILASTLETKALLATSQIQAATLAASERQLNVRRHELETANAAMVEQCDRTRLQAEELGRERIVLRSLLDTIPDGIFIKDAAGVYRVANHAFAEFLGQPIADIVGRTDAELFGDRVADAHIGEDREMYESGKPRIHEEDVVYPDGRTAVFEKRTAQFFDASGAPAGLIGISRDISARKGAEELIRVESRKSEALLEGAPDAIIIVDGRRIIRIVNRATQNLFGYSRAEIIGQPVEMLVPVWPRFAQSEVLSDEARRQPLRDADDGCQLTGIDKSGRVFAVEIGLSLIDGVDLVAASVRDISIRKTADEELRRAKDTAETATRAKADFLATMSHEIRTPMNGVMSIAEILNQTELSEDQHNMTRVIWQSADALRTVINDILDFSKIEAGKLEIEIVEFDIADVVGNVGDLLAPRAEERWLEFHIEIDPAMPRLVKGDPTRIRQILLNLGSNAVKFTKEGSVEIVVGGSRRGAEWLATFDVVDSGIGIAPEQMALLFQAFSQAERSTSRRFGGTGLGLSISKRLSEMMNGDLACQSADGKGTQFRLTLPLRIVDARPAQPESQIGDARVLLANYESREVGIVERYLQYGGVISVQSAQAAAHGGNFAAAMLDVVGGIDLVLINGREGAQSVRRMTDEMRHSGKTGAARNVVTAPHLAASILRADSESLGDPQWLATITTPIRLRRLWQIVGAAIGRNALTLAPSPFGEATKEHQAPTVGVAAAAGALVLVAEDNATNQYVINRVLTRWAMPTSLPPTAPLPWRCGAKRLRATR